MSKKFFDTIMRGMEEAKAYMEGARDGYTVTESPSINAKGIGFSQAPRTGQKTAPRTPAKENKRR
jgi:hypothetical protein